MPKPKQNTVGSIAAGEAESMDVDTAQRWHCSCGDVGPWMERTTKSISNEQRNRPGPQPAEMVRLLRAWQVHVERVHPDADLSFGEWAPEEDPE